MIKPTVTVDRGSLADLERSLGFLAAKTRRSMKSLVKQASIMAITSAAKATKPGKGTKVSKMADKYKFRKLETMPSDENWYEYETQAGETKVFRADQRLRKRKGLRRFKKGVRVWHKRTKQWVFRPWKGPRVKSNKLFRIPHFGAAKAGWLQALRKFGRVGRSGGFTTRLSRVQMSMNKADPSVAITNLVKYVILTSPMSGRRGVQAAAARMRNIARKEIIKIEATSRL
jgi:hypothetical protein